MFHVTGVHPLLPITHRFSQTVDAHRMLCDNLIANRKVYKSENVR